ncbi:hypothetical protein F5887DRAFT_951462 [Amanita rubescens]|nr:hypothetical protein F5887DRAFT_951462 [Amanita rubescens]
MTVDQLKKDLYVVAENARDLASSMDALGDSITVAQTTILLSKVPTIKYNLDRCDEDTKDIVNVSDSEAESALGIIKDLIPDMAKVSELLVKKKDAFAQLPNAFSIEGLFVIPTAVGGTITLLFRAQIEGLHTRVMTVANKMHQLAPPSHKEEATSIKTQIDGYFQQALKAYS